MALTLAQFENRNGVNTSTAKALETVRTSSHPMDNLAFVEITAGEGGAFTHRYSTNVGVTAASRALNSNYAGSSESLVTWTNVTAGTFGHSFKLDRRIVAANPAEAARQAEQSLKATTRKAIDEYINGDLAVDGNSFDGAIKTATTIGNVDAATAINLVGVNTQAGGIAVLGYLDALATMLDGTDNSAFYMDKATLGLIRSAARYAGGLDLGVDGYGRSVEKFQNIPLVALGSNGSQPIVRTALKKSPIIAVNYGIDEGVSAITPAGDGPYVTYLPNFASNGEPVLVGTTEVCFAPVFKGKAVAALTNVQIQP